MHTAIRQLLTVFSNLKLLNVSYVVCVAHHFSTDLA